MHSYERGLYGALLDAASRASEGDLEGPIRVGDRYSVFQLIRRVDPVPEAYDRVALRVAYWLSLEKESELFAGLLDRLRQKYAGEVNVLEDQLRLAARLIQEDQ